MKKLSLFLLIQVSLLNLIAQRVGIGTNIPTFPLTVAGVSNKGIAQKDGTVEIGFYTSPTSAFLQTWSNHPLYLSANNGAAFVTVLPGGNVGINTTDPQANLDIDGTLRIRSFAAGVNRFLGSDANGNATWQELPVGKAASFRLAADQTVYHNNTMEVQFADAQTGGFNDWPGSFNNTTREFTVPAGQGGTYLVTVQLRWSTPVVFSGKQLFNATLNKNGVDLATTFNYLAHNTVDASNRFFTMSQVVKLNASDKLDVQVFQYSGFSQTLVSGVADSYLSILRVR